MARALSSRILAFGRHAPERRVPNAELEAHLGLEAGWIARRTGIRARRYAAPSEALTDIALPAAEAALATSGVARDDIALTLLATSTPDHLLPPSAPLLAHRLGLPRSGAVDLAGACAGFLYALALADGFVRAHGRPVLVVAANILSRRINPDDKVSAVLFADAAGACVLGPCDDPATGILGADLTSDGAHYGLIRIPVGGSRSPYTPDAAQEDLHMVIEDGAAVFAQAVATMTRSAKVALAEANLSTGDITRFVPHQANTRIFEAVRRNLDLPEAAVVSTIAEFGNSSAATIPFSLAASAEEKPFRPGERVLLTAVGAGLTGGALVVGF